MKNPILKTTIISLALCLTFTEANAQNRVERGTIKTTILTTGTVEPQNRLEIKPPIAGRVEEVLVNEGDNVKRGDLLAWMSSSERAALLDAARARSDAEYKKWQKYYNPTPIYAPIDGMVILRDVEPGQTFTAQDAVFVLSDKLAIKAQVDETDLGEVKLNQKASVTLDAYSKVKIPSHVAHIAYEATTVNNVTTYIVDVIPDETPDFVRSGMTANVSFEVSEKTGVLTIPQSAVKYDAGKPYVLVPGKDKPRKVNIVTGESDNAKIELISGLNEGDEFLTENSLNFDPKGDKGASPFMPKFGRRKK